MGSFLDKPKTEKTNDCGNGNGLHYGLAAMQGWRIEMEDSHSSVIGLPHQGLESWSFFAVFDGHAGGTVSKFSSKELLNSILNADTGLFNELASLYNTTSKQTKNQNVTSSCTSSMPNSTSSPNKTSTYSQQNITLDTSPPSTNEENPTCHTDSSSINPTNLSPTNSNNSNENKNILEFASKLKLSAAQEDRLKKAIRQGFLDLDEKLRRMPEFDRGEDKSGSTAVACLITPASVYLINCGDSRAILISDNQVVLGTYDHKPINPNERERIQNAGGSVMIQRVNGSLAVSRALGDYEYKCVEGRGPCEQLVSPEPEIYSRERCEKDEYVVLACDGIWDVMTNDELREYIHSRLKITNDLVKICNDILDMCLNKVKDIIKTKIKN